MSCLSNRLEHGNVGWPLAAGLVACLVAAGCGETADGVSGDTDGQNVGENEGAHGSGTADGERVAMLGAALGSGCFEVRWQVIPPGVGAYHFLDIQVSAKDRVVTRTFQNNTTQLWCFTAHGSPPSYTIQHQNFQGQFLDAPSLRKGDLFAELHAAEFEGGNPHPSQLWTWVDEVVFPTSGQAGRLKQVSTGRYLDGYPDLAHEYRVMTRPSESDQSQFWVVGPRLTPPAPF